MRRAPSPPLLHHQHNQHNHAISIIFVVLLILTAIAPSHALVTTMVNATTSQIQEQWVILHAPSVYGPETPKTPFNAPTIIPTDPYLCTRDGTQDFTGKIVLIQRGNCPFYDKSYNAQLGNATGVIVGSNDDEQLVSMSYDADKNTTEIKIPSVMIRKSPFEYIRKMHQHAQPNPPPPPPDPETLHTQRGGNDMRVDAEDLDNSPDTSTPFSISAQTVPNAITRQINPHTGDHFTTLFNRSLGGEPTPIPFRIFTSELPHLVNQHPLSRLSFHPLLDIFDDTDPLVLTPITRIRAMQLTDEPEVMAYLDSLPQHALPVKSDNYEELSAMRKQHSKDAKAALSGPFDENGRLRANAFNFNPQIPPMQYQQLNEDPFDPDENPDPFYWYLSIDERGETYFTNFPFRELQIVLLSLMALPLLWILFIIGRWLRLYWGFRCVEELVTNTASNLPICVYIQTNEFGEIVFDSGQGTAANNQINQDPNALPNYVHGTLTAQNDPRARQNNASAANVNVTGGEPSPTTYGAINVDNSNANSNSHDTLFSFGFKSSPKRPIIIAPSYEVFEKLKGVSTVSQGYISTALTAPHFTPSQQQSYSNALTFISHVSGDGDHNVNDPVNMSHSEINMQTFHSLDKSQHLRVHNDTCNICLENFVTGDQVKILGCFHAFHPACIDQYFHSTTGGLGASTDQTMEARQRNEQRRMYAMAYIQTSYDFDELTQMQQTQQNEQSTTGTSTSTSNSNAFANNTNTTTGRNVNNTAGQSCPVCRRSILQTARYNSVIHKKWWIHLFEWLCLCSCCCPGYRRRRRQRRRLEEQNQRPVILTYDSDSDNEAAPRLYNQEMYQYNRTTQVPRVPDRNLATANIDEDSNNTSTNTNNAPHADNLDNINPESTSNPLNTVPYSSSMSNLHSPNLTPYQPLSQPHTTTQPHQGYSADEYRY